MVAMGILGLLSAVSTLSLILFITYRMLFWRRYYEQPVAKNQVLLLLYNLLLADFQQSMSFVISFYWVSQNKLVGPSRMCFLQAWLIHIGDVSSGLWVFSIGIHTLVSVVFRKKVPTSVFITWAVAIWAFCIAITAAGPIKIHNIFIPTAAWCWIDSKYLWERFYLHYAYIFLAQLGSIIVYTFIVIFLRSQITLHNAVQAPSSGSNPSSTTKNDTFAASRQRILQTARYMVLYPVAYVILTLPLASARVAAMAGCKPPVPVYILAGAMMTSCGWVDALLYFTTRKILNATKGPVK
ncbi:G protein-coupled glucose receptor regulating Gpa2-domain-containing protein [Tricladium varicosporioides]|nr:G protein-coupled glucose receptor regulating Gpa2-domain-containing protein [Hymenoscyphus varicosporioides]